MGYGSYRASDWAKLKSSRGISASSNADQIFRDNSLQEKYDPRFINVRESRDSEDSPESTPIIIAFDVTGSMGYLAAEIAKNSLDRTITELYDKQPVTNPHVMCAAITSPDWEGSLQVTQFEADIRVFEQLLDLKIGFGGNRYSYDSLIWYFAAKHTSIDSYEKHGRKGFLFVLGDEICGAESGEKLTQDQISGIFNDQSKDLSLRNLLYLASEKYEIFHIVTHSRASMNSFDTWNAFLPGRVALIRGENIDRLSEVITSIMQLSNGMDRESVIAQWPEEVQGIVREALKSIRAGQSVQKKKGSGSIAGKLFS